MRLINKWLYNYTAWRPTRLIKINDKPYLERYYLGRLFGLTFYLHRFVSGDSERYLHNHPWTWSRAFVLSGGYDEEVVLDISAAAVSGCMTYHRRIRWHNKILGSTFHRISNAAPGTWTLFVHSERQLLINRVQVLEKGWGFLEPARMIPGGPRVVVFRPHESANRDWWKTAPQGIYSGRVRL